jgi:hypothetical protein
MYTSLNVQGRRYVFELSIDLLLILDALLNSFEAAPHRLYYGRLLKLPLDLNNMPCRYMYRWCDM